MNKKFDGIIEMEKKVQAAIESIKSELNSKVSNVKVKGIKKISNSPNCFTVSLSKLRNGVLAPEYYSQNSQAKYIEKAFNGVNTVSGFIAKVNQIIEDKYVIVGGNRHTINEETIKVLKKYNKI